jgi:hypothetical protein
MIFLTNLYNNVKFYLFLLVTVLGGVFAALFFYEKRKVQVDDTLIKEEKLNTDLAHIDSDIAKNNQGIADEKVTQALLEKEASNENASLDNVVDFLNKRK